MLRQLTVAFLLGVIAAFGVLQLFYFREHGLSFTVVYFIDRWYVIRALSYGALLLLAIDAIRLVRAKRLLLEITPLNLIAFLCGGLSIAIVALLWRHLAGADGDFKFTPYLELPAFFVIALAAFYVIEYLRWRSNYWLERP